MFLLNAYSHKLLEKAVNMFDFHKDVPRSLNLLFLHSYITVGNN